MDVSLLVDVKAGTAPWKPGQFFSFKQRHVSRIALHDENHYRS